VHGILDDQLHAYRGSEVHDYIALAQQAVHFDLIGDGFNGEAEMAMAGQVGDVGKPPGGQVVNDSHLVTLL
jgi:hypothetical protein